MKKLILSMAIAAAICGGVAGGAAQAATIAPNIYIPECGLPNGTLILCIWYDRLVNAGEVVPSGKPATYTPLTAAMVGTTPTTIVANFPATMTTIFTNSPYINIQMGSMSGAQLALFSHSYYVHTKGAMAPLLTVAAKRLSALNLYSFASAFGPSVVAPYVDAYSPATVKASYAAYIAAKAVPVIPLSQYAYDLKGYTAYTMNGLSTGYGPAGMTVHSAAAAAWIAQQTAARAASVQANGIQPDAGYVPSPLPSMSLSDIWLEFYCAGVGTTAAEATVMSAAYAAPYLSLAGWAGYQIGTAIYNVTEYLDPGYFEDMIEYFGNLWSAEVLPTGTVTVGDPIDLGGVSGGWDDFDDFDICIEGITC